SSASMLVAGPQAADVCELSAVVVVQPDEDLAAVERCVRSVLATADGLDLEVVLVDATGKPEAHRQLADLQSMDARIKLAWIDHDPGAAAARNLGLRASRGRFVAILDPSVELVASPWRPLLAALTQDQSDSNGSVD